MTESSVPSSDSSLEVNLEKMGRIVSGALPLLAVAFFTAGYFLSFYLHFLTVFFFVLTLINLYYLFGQKKHALLANFGILAQSRYLIESIGPELRQYLFSSDTEERPFSRVERADVYRKAKNVDSSVPFGSKMEFDGEEFKLRHSLFPASAGAHLPFHLCFGEERALPNRYETGRPLWISGMSYGALGKNAVRALARGARKANIAMNTGEGGYPKYHLMEGADLIFQMGTAKFGVRDEHGKLDPERLAELAQKPQVKMLEIKFSQGAKPGKGGLLPKEKIDEEIAELRGVPLGQDVVSPPHHEECTDAASTVAFIRRIQEIGQLPVGIKLCLGKEYEFESLVRAMKKQDVFPDYMALDGAEGGTGAAPKAFLNDVGVPLLKALPAVDQILRREGVRDRLKLVAAGKLIDPGRQLLAMALGAQSVASARGFMLAIGCIQALRCHNNTCPVGITTHDPSLQRGLDIEEKSERVKAYVHNLCHDQNELLGALGKSRFDELDADDVLPASRF